MAQHLRPLLEQRTRRLPAEFDAAGEQFVRARPVGPDGVTGPQGATGIAGGVGGFLGLASSLPVVLSCVLGGLPLLGAIVGTDGSIPSPLFVLGVLPPLTGLFTGDAFVTPPSGITVTGISAFLETTVAIGLLGSVTVTAQLYIADVFAPDIFTPLLPAVAVTFAPLAILDSEFNSSGAIAVNIPGNSRVVLVLSAVTTDLTFVTVFEGIFNGSLTYTIP